jgi:hypothetical protein
MTELPHLQYASKISWHSQHDTELFMTSTVASVSVENSWIYIPYLTAWRVSNFKPRYTIHHTGLLQYKWFVRKILTPMSTYFHIDICYICCRTEYVSRGVLQMIREAPNGSLWVSENEKPSYQVIIPSRQSLRDEWIIYGKIRLLRNVIGNEAFQWLPNRWDIETDT